MRPREVEEVETKLHNIALTEKEKVLGAAKEVGGKWEF